MINKDKIYNKKIFPLDLQYSNEGHLFDGRSENTLLLNDATYVTPIRVSNLGETKKITEGLPLGTPGQWLGLALEGTPEYIPFSLLLQGLGLYLQTDLPTEEEQKLILLKQREEILQRNKENPYESVLTAGLLGLMNGFNIGIFSQGPIKSAIPLIGFGSEAAIKASKWYTELVNKVGQEKADLIITTILTPLFKEYFFGKTPENTLALMKLFLNLRLLINTLTGNVDEGKAALAGFSSINKSGTGSRLSALSHDIDLSTYIENASKIPIEDFDLLYPRGSNLVARQLRNTVLTKDAISNSPFLLILKLEYPEEFKNLVVHTMTRSDIKKAKIRGILDNISKKYKIPIPQQIKNLVYEPYKSGVIEINPLINRSSGGTNRFVRTKINGQDVDIFFSDAKLPLRINSNTMDADNTLKWKLHFIDNRVSKNLEPRAKDVKDIANYVEFSKQNPIIDEVTGVSQYSPINFQGNLLITEEGLPYLGEVLPYPQADHTINTFMNINGDFWPIKANGGKLNKYSKGTEHDLSNKEILDLIKKGYKISYL